MFVKDEGFCKSVREHEEYWMKTHGELLKQDLEDIRGYDSFVNGFEKLPYEAKRALIQMRPLLYRYHRETSRSRRDFLPLMVNTMRLLRKEYCRRKQGKYILKIRMPDITKLFGTIVGNDRILDFRITQEVKREAAQKARS